MTYSEKTQREFDKYTRKLVKRQPRWLRTLFDAGKIFFSIDNDGTLMLAGKDVNQQTIDTASTIVGKYLDKNPSPIIGALQIQ